MCAGCLVAALAGRRPPTSDRPFPDVAKPFPLPPVGFTLQWTGVAGFVLEREGYRLAIDPFVTRPSVAATLFRAPRPDAGRVARVFGRLDAALVGHAHHDHAMDLPAVAAVSPDVRVFGGATVVELARRLGVPDRVLTPVVDGTRLELGPFRVEAVRSEHGKVPLLRWFDRLVLRGDRAPRTPFRFPRGEVFAWRVETPGLVVHVQGSAGIDDAALLRQDRADVLVACLAARRGTPRYLERLAERLSPKVLVPSHHDDFFRPLDEPPRPVPTLRWSRFLEEAALLERLHGTVLWLPARGQGISA